MPGGRPTDYTPELAVKICEHIISGESLRTIAKRKEMPSISAMFVWMDKYPAFKEQYARAKEAQMDAMAEEIQAIADDTEKDTHTTIYENGVERVSPNTEWISRSRLRVDTRKWLMSKLAPKKYADKIVQQHTGADGGPLTVSWKKAE